MRREGPTRILALDLHPRSFGYVVVESPSRLLDWGVSSYRGECSAADVLVRKRLRQLLDFWRPAALVLYNPLKKSRRPNRKKDKLIDLIVAEAKSRRIVVCVPGKGTGDRGEIPTKYEIDRRVGERLACLMQPV